MNEIIAALQQVTVTVMALGLLGFGGWFAIGRRAWRAIGGDEGWFHRLDTRLTKLEANDASVRDELALVREAQARNADAVSGKFAEVIAEQRTLRVDLHALATDLQSHSVAIARLQGIDAARREDSAFRHEDLIASASAAATLITNAATAAAKLIEDTKEPRP